MGDQVYVRLGDPYRMLVVPEYGGLFLAGKSVSAMVMRASDRAMFDFEAYEADPTQSAVWAAPGAFPSDLGRLRGAMSEYKIGAESIAYERMWDFPENSSEGSRPQRYFVWYVGPSSLGIIGVEEVVFVPATLSFNAYYANPISQGQLTARPG